MCGEKTNGITPFLYRLGSPPRVRGKVNLTIRRKSQVRITPACAGKRVRPWDLMNLMRDHPRVCGEKVTNVPDWALDSGSPPRVRGKGRTLVLALRRSRITPACAGKRSSRTGYRYPCWDHPRVCGEKNSKLYLAVMKKGSPPRVRGKVPLSIRVSAASGITPACAGKSARW